MSKQVSVRENKQYVVFQIADQEFGVDIHKVSIIEKFMNITRVPSTPDYIKGVVNLRGEIIPVMDLRTKFELPFMEADDDTRIIMLKFNEITLGVIVDSVAEVVSFAEEEMESVTSITNDRTLDYVVGIGKVDNRLITVLNIEKLITELTEREQGYKPMTDTINELNNFHLDVLKEIGNIGAGNAATALAKLLDKRIEMEVPQIRIMKFSEVSDVLGGAETPVVGILLRIQGDITGNMMFILIPSARLLVNILMGKPLEADLDFDEMTSSVLTEIGNILAGSYLSALSNMTNLRIMPGVPALAMDMAGAILSVPAIEFGKTSDTVLYIENVFTDGHDSVIGDLFLVPDDMSYGRLLNALGVV